MNQALAEYFERELAALESLAANFARAYPAEAGQLLSNPARVADPHLDRMIEGLAALTGRVHKKLDDEFPELTHAFLEVMYPHLLRPIPSMTVAQFDVTPARLPPTEGHTVARHTTLHTSLLGDPPLSCTWRTGYPVTLWPLQVRDARVAAGTTALAPAGTRSILRMQLECLGGATFAQLPLQSLRFYLSGENQLIASLYELLLHSTLRVAFRPLDGSCPAIDLPASECLFPVGFEPDEDLLPFPPESWVGSRLLMEFLSFPAKFLFVDLRGFEAVRDAGFGAQIEVLFYLSRKADNVVQGVKKQTLLLGCTPVVNLFTKSTEPIAVTHTRTEVKVLPSRTHPLGMEVYSIDEVALIDGYQDALIEFRPFFDFGLGTSREQRRTRWQALRRRSLVPGDAGTDVYLVLLDQDLDLGRAARGALHVRATCTNRDLPYQRQRGLDRLWSHPDQPAPPAEIRCLQAPTPALRPPLHRDAHWRLLAVLSLNHHSLADAQLGVEVLKETLRLCDFSDEHIERSMWAVNRQMIEGIVSLRSSKVLAAVSSAEGVGYCRGLEFQLELDDRKYVGAGVLLFASVLERFLALAAAVNSFSQLSVRTTQGDFTRTWPPRSAHQALQ